MYNCRNVEMSKLFISYAYETHPINIPVLFLCHQFYLLYESIPSFSLLFVCVCLLLINVIWCALFWVHRIFCVVVLCVFRFSRKQHTDFTPQPTQNMKNQHEDNDDDNNDHSSDNKEIKVAFLTLISPWNCYFEREMNVTFSSPLPLYVSIVWFTGQERVGGVRVSLLRLFMIVSVEIEIDY